MNLLYFVVMNAWLDGWMYVVQWIACFIYLVID